MAETIERVKSFLEKNPPLMAATMGFDKKPGLHRIELCYEEDSAFWFAAPKCESYYGEISLFPYLTLCAYDQGADALLRLKGAVVFSEDEAVIARCLSENAALKKAWGKDPGMLIAYFLKDMTAELIGADGSREEWELGTPENVLIGITIKKDKELRDRLIRLMERREAETPELSDEDAVVRQKKYDGMLLYLAEKAKEVWPRMDISPAERSVIFETYDEREKYTLLAKKRLGNTRIDKPEDFTYWLGTAPE